MPAITTCPECRRELRVPASLLGTQVRCPHCQTEFAATASPPNAPAPAQAFYPLGETIAKTPTLTDGIRAGNTEPAAPPSAPGPMPLPPRPDLDEDDEGDDDLEERFEETRRRRIDQESLQTAKQRVLPPAICLIVVGTINLVIDVFRSLMLVVQMATMPPPPPGRAPPGMGPFADPIMLLAIGAGSIGVCVIWGAFVLNAGIRLKQLRSFGMVMTGCIIAMLPCMDGCCVLGLPFAIWSLVLIHDDQIRRHFK